MYNDVPQTIKQLQDFFPELSKIALKQPYLKRECFNDKKLEGKAHTAISPTLENPRGVSLSDNESKMFWIVAMRYFIQFMDDYKYSQISIDGISSLDMKKIEIKASEKVEISRGFKELYDSGKRDSQVQTFPELSKGDPLDIVSIILEQKDKKPKPRFDTVSLAKGMEKISTIYDNPELKKHLGDKGIGTSSTRSATIKAIIREGYAEEIKGKIHATQRGIDYIDTIPDEISEPVKRANLEEYLNQILLGKISKEQFMNASKKDIFKLVASIKNISKEKGIKVSNGGSDPKKAQDYALKIAKNIGVTLDDEILEDRAKLSGWLDKNVKKAKFGLSDKQKSMIIKHCEDDEIKKLVDTTDPKELKKVKKALDDIFASWNKKKKSSTPDRSM
ncbi:MAG: hypothetical protein HOG49_09330, partial [Candidatus Scalindua sp.]|nr:hypothetical protein [Candidatus Scalindua sp.]